MRGCRDLIRRLRGRGREFFISSLREVREREIARSLARSPRRARSKLDPFTARCEWRHGALQAVIVRKRRKQKSRGKAREKDGRRRRVRKHECGSSSRSERARGGGEGGRRERRFVREDFGGRGRGGGSRNFRILEAVACLTGRSRLPRNLPGHF